jgi:hypothetical protein
MKYALLFLAGVALAVPVPAFASSIVFYGVQTSGRYAGGGASMAMGKQLARSPAEGMFNARNALLPKESAVAFNRIGWTGTFANDTVRYAGSGLLFGWKETTLSGVHSPRLNLIGGMNGHLYKGHGLNRESLRTVPEPETLGLLGTGLFVIGGLVRRKLKMDHLVTSSHIYRTDGGLDARERNFRTGTLTRWYGAEKGISL